MIDVPIPLRSQILQRLSAQLHQSSRNSLPKSTHREQSHDNSISTNAVSNHHRASHQYLLTEGAESNISGSISTYRVTTADPRTERRVNELELYTTRDTNRTQRDYERYI